MRTLLSIILLLLQLLAGAQPAPKQLAAKRVNGAIKIDGVIDEAAWKGATPATDFVEWRPNAGKREDTASRTLVYLLYDNTSVYRRLLP